MSETDLNRAMALVVAAGALNTTICAFRVGGEPVAKARARAGRHGFYSVGKTADAEGAIANMAREGPFLPGNVAVGAIFFRSNRHRIDVDNLLKTVLDGITKSRGIWEDDSHVTALVGVIEFDGKWPRTAIAVAPHISSLQRGVDALTHTCATCGKKYRPHQSPRPSFYCSRACRPRRVLVCATCGGPTSAPQVRRCRSCAAEYRRATGKQSVRPYGERS